MSLLAARAHSIAIAGNPNTGKTTLFNRLTGSRAKVGNYPGVTVERQSGELELRVELGGTPQSVELLDVPGTYSLSARSREEQLAIQAVCGLSPLERPDAVLLVVDATQLTRNLYLALQILEADLPTVIALNMVDMLEEYGLVIDARALERELGVPVVPVSAVSGEGIDALRAALERVLADPSRARPGPHWIPSDAGLLADIAAVEGCLPQEWHHGEPRRARALALWALLSLDESDELADAPAALRAAVIARRRGALAAGRDLETEIIRGRYAWIDERAQHFLRSKTSAVPSFTDRLDRILLHPAIGFAAFLLAMAVIFQSLFSWADPAIGLVEALFDALSRGAVAVLPPGIVADFVANGLIAGVGSVLVFLPQIMLLFFFIGLMEDTGYMARVAFIMDRLMKSIGLHGRAFVPMMSGFACAVPAILATRTMERQRDRFLTMLVVPLMTCSARLPVYTLIIAALFPPSRVFGFMPVQGLLMVAMYLFSTVIALVAAAVLGRTLFKGKRMPLLLEMPPYRKPHWRTVLFMMWLRSKIFVTEAGTVILVCTIAIWGLLRFPWSASHAAPFAAERASIEASVLPEDVRAERLDAIEHREGAERLQQSFGGRLGRAIEPVIAPLGFDWKIGIGLLGAFAAREVFVSTMGVVYGVGSGADEGSSTLREKLRSESRSDGRPVYTPLVGLSLMVFFALACQCMSTLAAVRRETHSWRWPTFLFAYMSVLAYVASLVVYQGGKVLGFE